MKNIGLFIPCFIDSIYPNVAIATTKLLKQNGYNVFYPKDQTCCGQPLYNSGYHDNSKVLAEKFYDIFKEYDYIVAPSASCISMVKVHYKNLLPQEKYEELKEKSYEIIEFLHDIVQLKDLDVSFPHSISIHKSCHGLRELYLATPDELNLPYHDKVANLLNLVKDIDIKVMDHDQECCGFGGTFSFNENELSVKMGKDKLENFKNSNADFFVGYDNSCMMHLKSISDFEKEDIKYLHVVEILSGLKTKLES